MNLVPWYDGVEYNGSPCRLAREILLHCQYGSVLKIGFACGSCGSNLVHLVVPLRLDLVSVLATQIFRGVFFKHLFVWLGTLCVSDMTVWFHPDSL